MEIAPYDGDVPLMGPGTPEITQIDDLLRYLATVKERFGNTAVHYRVRWGASALWAQSQSETIIRDGIAAVNDEGNRCSDPIPYRAGNWADAAEKHLKEAITFDVYAAEVAKAAG